MKMKFLWATVLCHRECRRLQLKSHPFFWFMVIPQEEDDGVKPHL